MPAASERELQQHTLAANILKADQAWMWGGEGPFYFRPSGSLAGPWAGATWGTVPSPWRKDSLHVKLDGQPYLLMFLSEKWAFVALRCSDEQVSYGRLQVDPLPSGRLVF